MKNYQDYNKIFLIGLIVFMSNILEYIPEPKWLFSIILWTTFFFVDGNVKPPFPNNYNDKIVMLFSLIVFELSFAIYFYIPISYTFLILLIGPLLSIGIQKFFGSDDLWNWR